MLIITCIPTKAVIPIATRLPNISGAFIAIRTPLQMNIANRTIINAHPINPSSSPIIEKIKSLCGSGMYKYFCLLSPKPTPNNPPDPIAYRLCITCHPVSVASFHGSKNDTTLCNLYGDFIINNTAAGIPTPPPTAKNCVNLQPAEIIIIHTIPIITIDALKCGSINSSPISGANINMCFTSPLPKYGKSSLFFTNIPA